MGLPLRGDPNSLLVRTLALLLLVGFWTAAVWAPLGFVGGVIIAAFRERYFEWGVLTILLVPALVVTLVAVVARALAYGVMSGSRVAYAVTSVVLLLSGGAHLAGGAFTDQNIRIIFFSRGAILFGIGVLVSIVACRKRYLHAEADQRVV